MTHYSEELVEHGSMPEGAEDAFLDYELHSLIRDMIRRYGFDGAREKVAEELLTYTERKWS